MRGAWRRPQAMSAPATGSAGMRWRAANGSVSRSSAPEGRDQQHGARTPSARARPPPRRSRAPRPRARGPRGASARSSQPAKDTRAKTGAQRSSPALGSTHGWQPRHALDVLARRLRAGGRDARRVADHGVKPAVQALVERRVEHQRGADQLHRDQPERARGGRACTTVQRARRPGPPGRCSSGDEPGQHREHRPAAEARSPCAVLARASTAHSAAPASSVPAVSSGKIAPRVGDGRRRQPRQRGAGARVRLRHDPPRQQRRQHEPERRDRGQHELDRPRAAELARPARSAAGSPRPAARPRPSRRRSASSRSAGARARRRAAARSRCPTT